MAGGGHQVSLVTAAAPAPRPPALSSTLSPVAGGGNDPASGRPLVYAAVGAALALVAALAAFLIRRNGS